jgi:hypothetical protein
MMMFCFLLLQLICISTSFQVRKFCIARSTLFKSSHLSEDRSNEGDSLEESLLSLKLSPTPVKKGGENSNILSFAKEDIPITKKLETAAYDYFENIQNVEDKDTLRKIILQLEVGPAQDLKSFYRDCKTACLLMGKHRYTYIYIYIYFYICMNIYTYIYIFRYTHIHTHLINIFIHIHINIGKILRSLPGIMWRLY